MIKSAYIALMRQHHPDKAGQNSAQAEQRSKDINGAFAVLCDPQRRAAYDSASLRAASASQGPRRQPSPAEEQRYRLALAARRNRLKRVRLFQQGLFVGACLILGMGLWGVWTLFGSQTPTWTPAELERVKSDARASLDWSPPPSAGSDLAGPREP